MDLHSKVTERLIFDVARFMSCKHNPMSPISQGFQDSATNDSYQQRRFQSCENINSKSHICEEETNSSTPIETSPIHRPISPVQHDSVDTKADEVANPGQKLKQTKQLRNKKIKDAKSGTSAKQQ